MAATASSPASPAQFREPPLARFLFSDPRAAWLWLLVRLYLAYEWLSASIEKAGSSAWVGDQAGAAVTGFAKGALAKTGGDHPQVADWYAWFLEHLVVPNAALFGYLVVAGETLVGLALLVGALTGIASFFGIVMNANYLLSGTVSTNPILILLELFLILAWRNAGWLGLDRWLLPRLGTPWQPGEVFVGEGGAQPG